jgi:ribosomal protein L32
MRRNRSQTAQRRNHHGLATARVSKDESGGVHLRHRVNPETGMYRGKVVIDIVARAKKEQRRAKRRQTELRESGQETASTNDKETVQT